MEEKNILALKQAKEEIISGEHTCILIKNGDIIHRDNGRGVSPILRVLEMPEGAELLKGAYVADKIIGKAAAMLLVLGNAEYVYGELMSEAGKEFLERNNVPYDFGDVVKNINNFKGDGICPIEKSVLDVDVPEKAYDIIKATILSLRK